MSQRHIQIPAEFTARAARVLDPRTLAPHHPLPQEQGNAAVSDLVAPHIAAAALRAEREARERRLWAASAALHVSPPSEEEDAHRDDLSRDDLPED